MKTKEEFVKDRDKSISDARWIMMNDYFIVDTETTGLNNAQMCQIAILRSDGTQYKSFVKPTIPIEAGASAVHHITNEDVKDAPSAAMVVKEMPISSFLLAYNAQFDIKIIEQSLNAIYAIWPMNYIIYDVMLLYSAFRGEWDDYHGNYRWHKLAVACAQCGITPDEDGFHDALFDVKMTDKLLKYISCAKLSTEG